MTDSDFPGFYEAFEYNYPAPKPNSLFIVSSVRHPPQKEQKWILENDIYRLEPSEYKEDMHVDDILYITKDEKKAREYFAEIRLSLPTFCKYLVAIPPETCEIYEGIINLDDLIAKEEIKYQGIDYKCPTYLRPIPQEIHLSDGTYDCYLVTINLKGHKQIWECGLAMTLDDAHNIVKRIKTGEYPDLDDSDNIFIFGMNFDTPLPYLFDLPIVHHEKI